VWRTSNARRTWILLGGAILLIGGQGASVDVVSICVEYSKGIVNSQREDVMMCECYGLLIQCEKVLEQASRSDSVMLVLRDKGELTIR
jgi:hypothetical protein